MSEMSQPLIYTVQNIEQHHPGVIGHISRYEITKGFSIPLHNHDFFEIECGCKNSAVQTFNGEEVEFHHDDIYLIRPGDVHDVFVKDKTKFVFYNIAFAPRYLDYIYENYRLEFVEQWKTGKVWKHRLNFSPQSINSLRNGLYEMLMDTKRRFALDRFLLNFFYLVEQEDATPYGNCPAWLQATIERLNTPQWMQMGPRAMEKISGYSLEYINRILKKHNGVSPTDVLNQVRMKYATEKLCMSNCDIYELAGQCGFESPSYFFKLFKRTYGCSPLQYRSTVNREF